MSEPQVQEHQPTDWRHLGDGLVGRWKTVTIRGVIAIIFGIIALAWPGITVLALVTVFGAYAFLDGILALVTTFQAVEHRLRWWPFALEGVIGILIGVITFARPIVTAVVIVLYIAWWAILTGILELVAAVRLRRAIRGEWALAAAGVLSIILGLLLLTHPAAGAVSVVWVIGAYALVFGALLVALGMRLRRGLNGSVVRGP